MRSKERRWARRLAVTVKLTHGLLGERRAIEVPYYTASDAGKYYMRMRTTLRSPGPKTCSMRTTPPFCP